MQEDLDGIRIQGAAEDVCIWDSSGRELKMRWWEEALLVTMHSSSPKKVKDEEGRAEARENVHRSKKKLDVPSVCMFTCFKD